MLLAHRSFSLPGARRGSALAAVLIAAAALAGCDSTSSSAVKQTHKLSGAEGDAQSVVADMATRAAKTDPAGICNNDLDSNAQSQISGSAGSCEKGVAKALDTADSLQLDVSAVRITTDGQAQTAVAQITTPDDIGTRSITLKRASSKDTWKIDSFSATLTPKSKAVTSTHTASGIPQSTLPLTTP